MKNKQKFGLWLLMLVALVVGAGHSVSAEALGDGYSVMGINLGWALIGLAVLIVVLGWVDVLNKKVMKAATPVVALLLIVGLALAFVQVEDTTDTGTIDTVTGVTFDIDPTDPCVGGGFIDDVTWNDAETICTIPLEITGSGELDGNLTALNFTITPIAPSGSDSTNLATVYFESDYLMKYSGEYVLEENSDTYFANWTHRSGTKDQTTDDYSGSETMLLTENGYANISYAFDSGTSDIFSAELDSIGDQVSWSIRFHNADNTWSQTFTVLAMVTET